MGITKKQSYRLRCCDGGSDNGRTVRVSFLARYPEWEFASHATPNFWKITCFRRHVSSRNFEAVLTWQPPLAKARRSVQINRPAIRT